MKKPKIIVYHNIIQNKKVFIIVFIRQPLDFEKATEILNTYSALTYIAIPTGLNAITFIEKTDKEKRYLPTMQEFAIGKVMLMTLPDKKGELYDKSFEDLLKIYYIQKEVMFEWKGKKWKWLWKWKKMDKVRYVPYVNIQTNGSKYVVTYRDGTQVIVNNVQEAIALHDKEKERIDNG